MDGRVLGYHQSQLMVLMVTSELYAHSRALSYLFLRVIDKKRGTGTCRRGEVCSCFVYSQLENKQLCFFFFFYFLIFGVLFFFKNPLTSDSSID